MAYRSVHIAQVHASAMLGLPRAKRQWGQRPLRVAIGYKDTAKHESLEAKVEGCVAQELNPKGLPGCCGHGP